MSTELSGENMNAVQVKSRIMLNGDFVQAIDENEQLIFSVKKELLNIEDGDDLYTMVKLKGGIAATIKSVLDGEFKQVSPVN